MKTPIWTKSTQTADEMLEDVPPEVQQLYGKLIEAVRTRTQRIARETGSEPREVAEVIGTPSPPTGRAPAIWSAGTRSSAREWRRYSRTASWTG